MHPIAILCAAALGALVFLLGLGVSLQRKKYRVGSGTTDDPNSRLNRYIRAHANTTEFVPFLALLFLYLGAHAPGPLSLGLIVAATFSRYAIVFGLLTGPSLSRPNPARFIGALGTYLCGTALCIAMAITAFST